MYRIFITILFFIFFINLNFCFSQNVKYNLTIDASKKDTLKLSQIGEVIKIIPLEETHPKQIIASNQVVIDGEDIFLTFGYSPREIYHYDFKGNLKNKISVNEKLIKGSLCFHCDIQNNTLFLRSMSDTIYCFNYNGRILNKFEVAHRPPFYFFDGMLWGTANQAKDNFDIYTLFSTNRNGETNIVWEIQNDITSFPNMKHYRIEPSFSSNNSTMFFSMFFDQTIYKIENSNLIPYVEFQFINGQPDYYDYVAAPPQIINGKWIIIGYRVNQKWYSYIYNTKTTNSYNLPNKKILDDVFNTDELVVNIFNNMSNGRLAFLVSTNLIKDSTNKKDRGVALVLMAVD